MIRWQFALFKHAHFHGGQIKPNKVIVILHLADICNLYSKLYYMQVLFNQLCSNMDTTNVICGSGSLNKSFPGFSKPAASFLFSESVLQLNKSLIVSSSFAALTFQWVISTEGTQECGLDVQEPSQETLIWRVQIRQWCWLVPFCKITLGQNMFTNTMELPLNFAFSYCFESGWIMAAFIFRLIAECIWDVQIRRPIITQPEAEAVNKSLRDLQMHM